MNTTRHAPAALALAALLTSVVGCGGTAPGSDKQRLPPAPPSPAQYFKETQKSTMTTHGKVRTETVREQGDKIRYETDDGKKWIVGYSKRDDGTYDYQTPRPAE